MEIKTGTGSRVILIPDERIEIASRLCRELADGTNGNVPIQSVFAAMMKLIGRDDVNEEMDADWREISHD